MPFSELKTTKSKMDSQTKQVSEYASRMDDYDKKFEENSRKFGTLLAVSVFFLTGPGLLLLQCLACYKASDWFRVK